MHRSTHCLQSCTHYPCRRASDSIVGARPGKSADAPAPIDGEAAEAAAEAPAAAAPKPRATRTRTAKASNPSAAPGEAGDADSVGSEAAADRPRRRTSRTHTTAAATEAGEGPADEAEAKPKRRAPARRTKTAAAPAESAAGSGDGEIAAEATPTAAPAAAPPKRRTRKTTAAPPDDAAAQGAGGGASGAPGDGGAAAAAPPKRRAARTRRTAAKTESMAADDGVTSDDVGGEAAEVVTALRRLMKLGKSPWHVSAADRAALSAAFPPPSATPATSSASAATAAADAATATAIAAGADPSSAALERAGGLLQLFGDAGRQLLLAAPGWALSRPAGELLQWLDGAVAVVGQGVSRLWLLQVAAREPELLLHGGGGGGGIGGGGGGGDVGRSTDGGMAGPQAVGARLEELAAAVAAVLPVVEQPALVTSRLTLLREHLAASHAAQHMAGERFHPDVSAWALAGVLAVAPRPAAVTAAAAAITAAATEAAEASGGAGDAEVGAARTRAQLVAAEAEDGAEALLRLLYSQHRHQNVAGGPALTKTYVEPLFVGADDVAAWHDTWRADYVAWRANALARDEQQLKARLGLAPEKRMAEKVEGEVPAAEMEGADVAAALMQAWQLAAAASAGAGAGKAGSDASS
ncbi:hypothetical protein HYH02_000693 [Chlamydomonas schloesseri]|uniref:Uncharacterized protein n=1 Tax=Chlamydomonas schloesseri TaxID=2026947 RepID=A0A835WWT7_9CHLO|nr:hypothetical protein HYH02_000693 [Chlamydomonas schloesseri]|eukprot:KAG2454862.1 hypothetical protein HYH02_000693 [Chlamydomonas schloesseri]